MSLPTVPPTLAPSFGLSRGVSAGTFSVENTSQEDSKSRPRAQTEPIPPEVVVPDGLEASAADDAAQRAWSPLGSATATPATEPPALVSSPMSAPEPAPEPAGDEAAGQVLTSGRAQPAALRCYPGNPQESGSSLGPAMVGTTANGPVPTFGASDSGTPVLSNAHQALEALRGAIGRASAVAVELGATPSVGSTATSAVVTLEALPTSASVTAFAGVAPALDVPQAPSAPMSPAMAEPLVAAPMLHTMPGTATSTPSPSYTGVATWPGSRHSQQHGSLWGGTGSSLALPVAPAMAPIGSPTAPTSPLLPSPSVSSGMQPVLPTPSLSSSLGSSRQAVSAPPPPVPLRPEAPRPPGGAPTRLGSSTPAGGYRTQHLQVMARLGSQTQRHLPGPRGC